MQQLPAYLRKSAPVDNPFLGGLGGNQPPTINRRNNRFTLIDAAGNQKPIDTIHLDVVVIDANAFVSKTFYEGDYDPANSAAPDCFSDNGTAPSVNAAKPQNDLCATCNWNAWGSGGISKISGKQVKGCQDSKKLACLVPVDGFKIAYMLQVPPASFKNLKQYLATLAGHGAEPSHVTTRLSFDATVNGVLTFTPVGWIEEATAKRVYEVIDSKASDSVVGRLDKPRQAALPAPKAEQQKPVGEPFFKQEERATPPVEPGKQPDLPPGMTGEQYAAFLAWTKEQQDKKAQADAAAEAPKRSRGRPKKEETVVEKGPIPEGMFAGGKPAPQVETKQPAQFGMVETPAAPDQELSSMLDDVFALPT